MTFGVDAGPRESERVSPGVATRWRERIDDRDSVGPWITSTTDPPFAVPGRGLGWTRSLHRGECPHTVSRIGLGDSRFVFFPQSGRVLHLTSRGVHEECVTWPFFRRESCSQSHLCAQSQTHVVPFLPSLSPILPNVSDLSRGQHFLQFRISLKKFKSESDVINILQYMSDLHCAGSWLPRGSQNLTVHSCSSFVCGAEKCSRWARAVGALCILSLSEPVHHIYGVLLSRITSSSKG
jgi:hypothetical protein